MGVSSTRVVVEAGNGFGRAKAAPDTFMIERGAAMRIFLVVEFQGDGVGV